MNDQNLDYASLDEAFSMNTAGNGRCYYGATLGDTKYEGERDWDARWLLLMNCVEYSGKNVLEIGCNMGIYISYLKKFRDINKAVGIDERDDMLLASNKADTMRAAKLLAKGLGVDVSFVQMDLNEDKYEEIVKAEEFDIAIAQSIYKWIDDGDRFLKYLSNFDTVIYEGHDPDEVEIERFTGYGFKPKIIGSTQTGKSYAEDNYRTLILFEK